MLLKAYPDVYDASDSSEVQALSCLEAYIKVVAAVFAGISRLQAVPSVADQVGAGAPGGGCGRVHAQPQCGAPRPHLQQPARH